jgi:membrane protease YdiL (CAAX protease family)
MMKHGQLNAGAIKPGPVDWALRALVLAGICAAMWFSFGWFQLLVPQALASFEGMTLDAFRLYDPLWVFGANNIAIGLTLGVLWICVRLIERRSFAELLSPDQRFRVALFARGFLAWAVAMSVVRVALSLAGWRAPMQFKIVPGLDELLLVAATFLIQAPAEELIFRGYLASRLAGLALLPGRLPALFGVIGSSLAFALIHFYHAAGTAQIFLLGLGCSLVRYIDGRLERAMGLHAALNIMIAVVFGLNGPWRKWPSLMRLPPAPRADWIDVAGFVATFALMLALSYGGGKILARLAKWRAGRSGDKKPVS